MWRKVRFRKPDSVEDIADLLRIEAGSAEADDLASAARALARERLGPKGRLWCAIGLDYRPCPMKCKFCAFASEWTSVRQESELTPEQVREWARYFVDRGADYLVLRTCESYDVGRLCDLARDIRRFAPRELRLVANTRQLTPAQAGDLRQAGFDGIYKTIRLREGIDTDFDPEKRLQTIRSMREEGLQVYSLVEPVGPEHTAEEIARAIVMLRDRVGPALVGAMARVPVPSTPLGGLGRITDEELAKITAVTVLALLPHIGNVEIVCSHPPSQAVLEAGANGLVVEVGAVPRDRYFASGEWRRFTVEDARALMRAAGLEI